MRKHTGRIINNVAQSGKPFINETRLKQNKKFIFEQIDDEANNYSSK